MKKLITFCKYAKFLGLLGLPGVVWDIPVLEYLWLLWLFGVVELILEFSLFKQSMEMLIGMISVPLKYGKRIPSKDNYSTGFRFSLPFSETWIVVNGGVEKQFSHSWSIPTQRYAYDFIILDETGKSFSGDAKSATSYYCYEKEILAPAGGIVVELLDGQPDSIISGKGTVDCSAKDIRGNYILIQHSERVYSLLAHLQKDSMQVNVGDRVVRGQSIARCGNSGNSTEPHLHFQLQDGKSFSYSAGIPIEFKQIEAEPFAEYASYDDRPVTTAEQEGPYISRGQAVHNLE